MRSQALIAASLAAAIVAALSWWWADRPVAVAESWSGPLESVSFAPFRRGQSPLVNYVPSPEQVDEDLKSLVGKVRGVRTYSSLFGLDVVPKLAAPLGLKVTQGAWLTSETTEKGVARNADEVRSLIATANAYPQAVERVIVGNEVLLRRDLPPDKLIAYIREVKAAIRQPVSYADVWVFFLHHPEVARELDYLTIHILPFWEDEPVPLDSAVAHVGDVIARIREAFPGKPILIGETGWPSLGRDRGPAVVDTVTEARYVRRIARLAAEQHLDYNIVEAFDQPWKAELEGTVGAYWGILDADRAPKFAMSGPVTEVADWPLRAGIAIVIGIAAALLLGRKIDGLTRKFAFALFAQFLAWLAVTTGFHVAAVSFRWWQEVWAVARIGAPAAMASLLAAQAARVLGAAGARFEGGVVERWSGRLSGGFAIYACVWSLLLALDGRYRDIPEIDFAVPCAGLAGLVLLRAALAFGRGEAVLPAIAFGPPMRRLWPPLAMLLLVGAALALASEGIAIAGGEDFARDHPMLSEKVPLILGAMVSNREMLLWVVMQLVMAAPFAAGALAGRATIWRGEAHGLHRDPV